LFLFALGNNFIKLTLKLFVTYNFGKFLQGLSVACLAKVYHLRPYLLHLKAIEHKLFAALLILVELQEKALKNSLKILL